MRIEIEQEEDGRRLSEIRTKVLRFALLGAILLLANGALQWLVDDDLGMCWTHNVIRNWKQLGLAATHGRLVTNPGGYQALEAPEVYPGHRPTSLYPVLLLERLFSWTGTNALPIHVLLAAAVLISIWYLLGRHGAAYFAAGVAILTPGYLLWPTIFDPNTNVFIAGFPFAALLWWRLRQPQLATRDYVFVLLLSVLVSALNWTMALVHALVLVWLFASGRIRWQRIAFYVGVAAPSSGSMALLGLLAKAGPQGAARPLVETLGGYTWGPGGYATGQGTSTLLTRLACITGLALFPFWILWAWQTARSARIDPNLALRALAPLAVVTLEALVLRNYFCAHPWMAAVLFLLAAVLSLAILAPSATLAAGPAPSRHLVLSSLRPAVGLAAGFAFCLVVVLLNREYHGSLIPLTRMVRSHTDRTDAIAVPVQPYLPAVMITNQLTESLDRFLLPVEPAPASELSVPASFFLSPVPLSNPAWTLAASTADDASSTSSAVSAACAWFRTHIARRKRGVALELSPTYYLYKVPAPPAPH